MNNIPPPIPVADDNGPHEAGDTSDAIVTPSPELLRSFVYREPTGLHTEDDDSHPHRRRSDRVPQK